MDITTKYLGLKLKNPIIVGSSTFTGTVDGIVNCAKAGAGAVVLKSLFEEQILSDIKKEEGYTDIYNSSPEADLYMKTFLRGNEIAIYENLIREAKKTVDIPIIAKLIHSPLSAQLILAIIGISTVFLASRIRFS